MTENQLDNLFPFAKASAFYTALAKQRTLAYIQVNSYLNQCNKKYHAGFWGRGGGEGFLHAIPFVPIHLSWKGNTYFLTLKNIKD